MCFSRAVFATLVFALFAAVVEAESDPVRVVSIADAAVFPLGNRDDALAIVDSLERALAQRYAATWSGVLATPVQMESLIQSAGVQSKRWVRINWSGLRQERDITVVPAELYEGERRLRAMPLSFRLTAPSEVCVARAAIPLGQAVRADDCILEVLRCPVDAADEAIPWESASAWVAKRSIHAKEALTRNNVAAQLPVRRNTAVQVQVDRPGVLVETTAVALRDGTVGDRISVRSASTGQMLMAEVVGPARVAVK